MRRVRKNNVEESMHSVIKKDSKKTENGVGASQITDTSASENSSEEHQGASMHASQGDGLEEDAKPPSKESTGEDEDDVDGDSTDDNTEDQASAEGAVTDEIIPEGSSQDVAPQPPHPQSPQGLQLPPNLAALAQPNVLNNILPGLAAAVNPAASINANNNVPSAAALGMLGGMGLDASTLQKLHEALQQRQQQSPPPAVPAEAPVLGHTAFLAAQLQQALKGSGDAVAKDSSAV